MALVRTQSTAESTMTVIGGSVQVKGNLSGDEDLHVLGRVDGKIELQRTLVVAESGVVKAEVRVKNAIVSGVVVGNIHATESVEITREGRMVGDIEAPRVIIVDGASFRGNVDMGDIENMPVSRPRTERPRPSAPPIPARAQPSPARPAPAASPSRPPMPAARPNPSLPPTPVAPTPVSAAMIEEVEEDDEEATTSGEPPQAKGLPSKSQKTRVIVKRK
jgi:cytoskeletal protein CcmA (bactofilin family)